MRESLRSAIEWFMVSGKNDMVIFSLFESSVDPLMQKCEIGSYGT